MIYTAQIKCTKMGMDKVWKEKKAGDHFYNEI